VTGQSLDGRCDAAVGRVCAADSFCCSVAGSWDDLCLREYVATSPSGTCSSGTFVVKSRLSGLCVDTVGSFVDGTPIVQLPCSSGLPNQHFILGDQHDGSYTVTSQQSGKCVSVSSGSQIPGAPIIQWSCLGLPEQRFHLVDDGHGSYALKAAHSGQCINIPGGSLLSGTPLIQWPCDLAANTLFDLQP
jgi:hypothetical protein